MDPRADNDSSCGNRAASPRPKSREVAGNYDRLIVGPYTDPTYG